MPKGPLTEAQRHFRMLLQDFRANRRKKNPLTWEQIAVAHESVAKAQREAANKPHMQIAFPREEWLKGAEEEQARADEIRRTLRRGSRQ